MSDDKKPENSVKDQTTPPEVTHAAVPLDVFRAIRQLLGSLPYEQVKQIIEKVDSSTRGISLD